MGKQLAAKSKLVLGVIYAALSVLILIIAIASTGPAFAPIDPSSMDNGEALRQARDMQITVEGIVVAMYAAAIFFGWLSNRYLQLIKLRSRP